MPEPRTLRILSSADLDRCLPMAAAIEAMASAFGQLASGRAHMPVRGHLDLGGLTVLTMPSHLGDPNHLAVKVLTLRPANLEEGRPVIQALVTLIDAATGTPLALLEGARLTALRTGAASGLATRLLARPESSVVAIFGAGVQGRTQLEAMCAVRPIREAWIFDPRLEVREAFALEMTEALNLPVRPTQDLGRLQEADLVCTATNSTEALFASRDLKPGCHINATGSYTRRLRELPDDLPARCRLVVDHRASSLAETGDLLLPLDRGLLTLEGIHAELGEVVNGTQPGRQSAKEITLFKSVGLAIQDAAAASAAYARALELGCGTVVAL